MSTIHDDDILDEHRDLVAEGDDDTELVRKLRGELKGASKRAKDRDRLFEENRTLKSDSLISGAGLSDLKAAQRETLAEWAAKQNEVDADAVYGRAVDLGWAEPKIDPADTEIEEHSQIAAAQRGAAGKGAAEITPQMAAAWDQQRIREFRKAHPAEWEQLKQGQTVSGLTF